MKRILSLLLSIGLLSGIQAQKRLFVRIYDASGKKIAKGYIADMDDTGLRLRQGKGLDTVVAVSDIQKIRLYRHPFRLGGMVAALPVGAGLGLIADGRGWNGLAGLVLIYEGLILSGVSTGIKAVAHPRALLVEGDGEKWQKASAELRRRMNRTP